VDPSAYNWVLAIYVVASVLAFVGFGFVLYLLLR
jgi:hypothetical protein